MQKSPLVASENLNELASLCVKGMQEMKAQEIVVLNLSDIEGAEVDSMMICHATSDTHAEGIARSVEAVVMQEGGEKPWQIEGLENREWILLDYVHVVVHIFLKEKRDFYNLEGLWGDAEIKHIDQNY